MQFLTRTVAVLLILNISLLNTTSNCPTKCDPNCLHDNQGLVVKATCTNIAIQDLPNSLEHLTVSGMTNFMISSQGRFHDEVLANKTSLQTLAIHNYMIRIIDGSSFRECSRLTTLDVSKNHILNIYPDNFVGLAQLQYLNINNNELIDIANDVFKELHSLLELELAENRITTIHEYSLRGLLQLQKINLQSNRLTRVHVNVFQGLRKLIDINLRDNMLHRIEAGLFHDLPSLRSLSLEKNHIVYIDAAAITGTPGMAVINIKDNNLTAVPTQFLRTASNTALSVNLAINNILTINQGDLENVKLKSLYLVFNKVHTIHPDALMGSSIETIDLQQNELQHVPQGLEKYIGQSNNLLLANNPLLCDCAIRWLANIVRQNDPQPVCASPQLYFGLPVLKIINELNIKCDASAAFPVPTKQLPVPPKQNPVTPKLGTKSTTTTPATTTMPDTTTTESSEATTHDFVMMSSPSAAAESIEKSSKTGLIIGLIVGLVPVLSVLVFVIAIVKKKSKVSPEMAFTCRKADANHRPSLKYLYSIEEPPETIVCT